MTADCESAARDPLFWNDPMNRIVTAFFALLLSAPAFAQGVTTWRSVDVEGTAAPVQYIGPARDLIVAGGVIVHVISPETAARMCPDDAPACAIQARAGMGSCHVYLSSALEPWFAQAITVLHEVPHCLGWDGDHDGARNPTEAELGAFPNAAMTALFAPPVPLTTAQMQYFCQREVDRRTAAGLATDYGCRF